MAACFQPIVVPRDIKPPGGFLKKQAFPLSVFQYILLPALSILFLSALCFTLKAPDSVSIRSLSTPFLFASLLLNLTAQLRWSKFSRAVLIAGCCSFLIASLVAMHWEDEQRQLELVGQELAYIERLQGNLAQTEHDLAQARIDLESERKEEALNSQGADLKKSQKIVDGYQSSEEQLKYEIMYNERRLRMDEQR
jgi:hypothetical protein